VGELFAKHMLEEPPQLIEFAPHTPAHMAAAIMKSLAKDPAARFQSMEDFRKALVGEVKVTAPASTGAKRLSNPASTMSTTISARASTTLSSASSEIDDGIDQIKPNRAKQFALGGAGVAVAAAAAYFLVFNKPTPPTPPAPPPVAATTTLAVTPPQPPPVPVKKMVTIRFEAEPAGTHVFRKKDDKDMGVVPVEVQLGKDAAKAGPDALAYILRLPGYKERPLTADVSTDRTFHVALEKVPPPVDPRHRNPAGAHHPAGGRHPRNPVDEDGLATPSF
jgi:hypothetical protein